MSVDKSDEMVEDGIRSEMGGKGLMLSANAQLRHEEVRLSLVGLNRSSIREWLDHVTDGVQGLVLYSGRQVFSVLSSGSWNRGWSK